MRYVGSKNKLSKNLVPVIQSYITDDTISYIEPFVGGANIIDKIDCKHRVGSDLQQYLIALLKFVQTDVHNIPDYILEDEYRRVKQSFDEYPNWYVGLVGFCASFGAKFFGGYARNSKNDNTPSWSIGAIKNLKKQAENLQNIDFSCISFVEYNPSEYTNCVFYCDPPYRNTLKYSTGSFPHDNFYEWVRNMSKNNIVLVSEYSMPEDFECVWSMNTLVLLDSNKSVGDNDIRTEKLFLYKGDK